MIRKFIVISLFYFVALMLTALPIALIRLGINADILPLLEVGIVYFSALYFPVPIWQIFLYGILTCELYGLPIGVDSALFIIIYVALKRMHSLLISRSPISDMIGFIGTVILFMFLKYLIMVYYFAYSVDFIKIVLQSFTTILFYPAIYYLLTKILNKSEC
jgi:cell shape-determining protein MreD